MIEETVLAAEIDYYDLNSLQYIFPINELSLYNPSGASFATTNPVMQDNKEDFQKQNISEFTAGHINVVRGYVYPGPNVAVPFVKLSYDAGFNTPLYQQKQAPLGNQVRVWVKIGSRQSGATIVVPYNVESRRYDIELWGYGGNNLFQLLDKKGQKSLQQGAIVQRPDLVVGSSTDFEREATDNQPIAILSAEHAMHPILPLHIECAWSDNEMQTWDSKNMANYHFEFNMVFRGWENYLACGFSDNPHGGVGTLEFRNLMSNYFGHNTHRMELGRKPAPWSFNAFGSKIHDAAFESFMTVDYMDLHVLLPNCSIGIHRHRDNQEIFLMMQGRALMMVGDWNKFPGRERCFEVRHMKAGDLALCKNGQLHCLVNTTDEKCMLFMFGGYD
jgi:mannose-6-phosphate isomerase-like protein (cupin superfamily)